MAVRSRHLGDPNHLTRPAESIRRKAKKRSTSVGRWHATDELQPPTTPKPKGRAKLV
jgi:hypothetical protein